MRTTKCTRMHQEIPKELDDLAESFRLGLLINFNTPLIRDGIKRISR